MLGRWLFLLAALLLATSACGPSAARMHCLDSCETNNSACIAQASTGPALQDCTSWTQACVAACPP